MIFLMDVSLHLPFHPLQAANCCRNFRLEVDLKNNPMKIVVLKPLGLRKLSHFLEMQNDALKHR